MDFIPDTDAEGIQRLFFSFFDIEADLFHLGVFFETDEAVFLAEAALLEAALHQIRALDHMIVDPNSAGHDFIGDAKSLVGILQHKC